jgi:lysophospholipase L1-like esterase
LKKRDINLGWGPSPADDTRHDPVFPIGTPPCLSLFGDSFTWSVGVADEDAWGSILAAKLKCRVANFGVGGYGTDQAFLRFRLLPPAGGVVLLNHLSENILRNVNQYRNLLYSGHEFAFKPRFVDRNKNIELVPMPEVPASDIQKFLQDPTPYLANEYFLPGGPSGIQKIKFPFTLAIFKAILTNYHIHAKLTGIPRYADFYRPEHSSHGLDVTYGILRSFALEARARGQVPIVTLIPTCDDLKYLNTTGVFPYDRLTKMIAAQGIRYIDFGEGIAKRTKGSRPESLYQICSGHFNEAGYRLLAEIAFDYLTSDPETERRLHAEY